MRKSQVQLLQLLLDFLKRLAPKIAHLHHIFFRLLRQIRNRIYVGAFQAVIGTDGQIKVFNKMKDKMMAKFEELKAERGD